MWFCGSTLVWICFWVYRLLSSNILGHGNGHTGSALSPSACCLQLLLKADTWGGIRTKWSYSGISCANSPYQEASEPGAVFLHFIALMSSTIMYLSIYPSTSTDIQPQPHCILARPWDTWLSTGCLHTPSTLAEEGVRAFPGRIPTGLAAIATGTPELHSPPQGCASWGVLWSAGGTQDFPLGVSAA